MQNTVIKQSGMTLILGVLVLATVATLSFSLGFLVLRELKSSRQLSRSEPAITTAEAGGETTLFFRIRKLTNYSGATVSCPTVTTINLSGANASYQVCNNFYDNPYIFNTSSTSVEVLILNDPANPANIAAGYSTLTFTATSGTASTINVQTYDLSNPSSVVSSINIAVNGTPQSLSGLNPNKSYAVFLIPEKIGNLDLNASGSITANGGSKGLPSKSPTISSTGSKDSLKRRLEILLTR